VIAESDATVVENNHYFPADSVRAEYLRDSTTTTACPWKGTASYKTLVVDGKENADAAWSGLASPTVTGKRMPPCHGMCRETECAGVVRGGQSVRVNDCCCR
jgi:hypothetical protein